MKNKMFFIFFVSLMIFNQAKAMDEKGEVGHLQKMPKVLILEIGSYLYGNDFFNFSLANKRINKYLTEHKNFYIPENKEEAIKILQETSFEKLEFLTLKWSSRGKTVVLKFLKQCSQQFSDHTYCIPMSNSDYERKMFNFEMDIKIKILSLFIGKKNIKEELIKLKQSKILAYYTTSPLLDNSPEAICLNTIQGAFIYEKLLNDLQENSVEEQFQKIKLEIINKKKFFEFVTTFFKDIKAPIEDQI